MKPAGASGVTEGVKPGADPKTARFDEMLGKPAARKSPGQTRTREGETGPASVDKTRITPPVTTRPGREQALSQLQGLLQNLRDALNGIAELLLPGGGAADSSRATTDPGQPLRRLLPSAYGDDKDAPSGADRPGARAISNAVSADTGDKGNKADASDMFWLWGQFLDHDIDLSTTTDSVMDIPVPDDDTTFEPGGELESKRSKSRDNVFGVPQQINDITALIDGSNIYGSDAEKTESLREGQGGRLRIQDDGTLPADERGFFEAGDIRVNENIGLTSMHTLFAREHNRVADRLASENPTWTDDRIFDAARTRVTAQLQSITVNEFLPVLLGGEGLGAYSGPAAGLDAQVSNSFAAAAYRFGHSMVSDEISLVDADGAQTSVPLKDAFFNPPKFDEVGIDSILRGLSSNEAQAMDTEIVDSLRNFVLDSPFSPRLDLAALNIQRGRDHGLPTLNDARRAFGLPAITSFDDPALRDGAGARLASVYDSPEDIDLWVGLLSEKPTGDGLVGPTQETILRDQFTRLRDGDPDWYAHALSAPDVADIEATSLADIIERNTDVDLKSDTAMTVA